MPAKKQEITVEDLQKEIAALKKEVASLKRELGKVKSSGGSDSKVIKVIEWIKNRNPNWKKELENIGL